MASLVAHGGGERTRNGLMKRVPRQRLQQPVAGRTPETPRLRPTGPDGAADRIRGGPAAGGHVTWPAAETERTQSSTVSAAEVRSRLTSLRAGIQRGEDDRAARDESTEGTGRVR
jgi:hypothetical protein